MPPSEGVLCSGSNALPVHHTPDRVSRMLSTLALQPQVRTEEDARIPECMDQHWDEQVARVDVEYAPNKACDGQRKY